MASASEVPKWSPEGARADRGPVGMLVGLVDGVVPAESAVDRSATSPEEKHVQPPRLPPPNSHVCVKDAELAHVLYVLHTVHRSRRLDPL